MDERHVVVVGGGVSGLATAHYLTRPGPAPSVTVLEAGRRLGGMVRSVPLAGRAVDTGPDALLVRLPAVAALLTELGLDDDRRAPDATGAYVWARGELRPLPQGSVFGVPDRLLPLFRSGLVSAVGLARASADLVLPRPGRDESSWAATDPTIEQLLRPRFGREVYQYLVEPLLGGVHAGRADRLSARSAVPEVAAMMKGRRSVFHAVRGREPRSGAGPAMVSLDGGLSHLIDALAASAQAGGAVVRLGAQAVGLEPRGGGRGGYRVLLDTGEAVEADDVVLAAPAWAAARLLEDIAPDAARAAGGIGYAGVATVTMSLARGVINRPGTGFLVPPVERRLLVGCTWLSQKWPHLASPGGADVVRCMVGRDGDQAWQTMDDATLVDAVCRELGDALGMDRSRAADLVVPQETFVRRLPQAMPQYTVGHLGRLAALEAELARHPGLHVVGAGYRGVGIASCIAQARTLATSMAGVSAPVPSGAGGTSR